jgi:hypothetical protein
MNPEPLIGVASDPGLEHIVALLSRRKNVNFSIPGFAKVQSGTEVENVSILGGLP